MSSHIISSSIRLVLRSDDIQSKSNDPSENDLMEL